MKIRPLWIVLGILGIIIIWMISAYNGMVSADAEVDKQFENIQTQYQRRMDLVPELVATVDMGAENEKEILTKVTQYRAGIGEAKSAEDIEKMEGLNQDIKTAINIAVEAYPQVRATDLYRDLQAQLEGTENRIAKSRTDYNSAVKDFNVRIKRFPGNFFNMFFGFEPREGFKAKEGAEEPVDVRKEFER
jgi:LemA protein